MKEENYTIFNILLTEKATLLSEKRNQYVFSVNPKANKIAIKEAVEVLFQKKVLSVNTLNYMGKTKRRGGRIGRCRHWKKAVVTLKIGEKIDTV